jgi:hypothetical protein
MIKRMLRRGVAVISSMATEYQYRRRWLNKNIHDTTIPDDETRQFAQIDGGR